VSDLLKRCRSGDRRCVRIVELTPLIAESTTGFPLYCTGFLVMSYEVKVVGLHSWPRKPFHGALQPQPPPHTAIVRSAGN